MQYSRRLLPHPVARFECDDEMGRVGVGVVGLPQTYLTADTFTAADAYPFNVTRARLVKVDLTDLEPIQSSMQRTAARLAVRDAFKTEVSGRRDDDSATQFTNPLLCVTKYLTRTSARIP
jgi:hypothetical protein